MKQNYSSYTKEDHEVWSILFKKQMDNLQDKSCKEYLFLLDKMKDLLNYESIPNYDNLNKMLLETSGWSIEVVEGLIPVEDFYQLLSKKKFCAPAWIRKKEQIDYLEEPDLFHDIIGHIPMFLNNNYADFIHQIGKVGVELVGNKEAEKELERLYWFTSEFGAIIENGSLKAYGAGLISSYNETLNLFNPETEILEFNFTDVISKKFRTDIIQPTYFYINSFNDLNIMVNQFEEKYCVYN